jgi:uncharacterized protein YcfJ
MEKSLVKGLVIGGIAATAIGAVAGYRVIENRDAYAEVVSVEPATRTETTPRQVCDDVVVSHQAPVKDPKRVTGAVVGAVVGGVVGNQIGDGDGQKLATVAGAAAGGYAGSKIQKRMQESNTYEATEPRCRTVYDKREVPDGYDVRYTWRDQEGTVRMDHKPGKRIPVAEDGTLLVSLSERGPNRG